MARKPKKEASPPPDQAAIDQAVNTVVANVQSLLREAGVSALLSAWRIGGQFQSFASLGYQKGGYGTQALTRAVELLSQTSESPETMSMATAYRYRKLNESYSEDSIKAMGAAGISTHQASAALAVEGITDTHINTALARIAAKEVHKSAFATVLKDLVTGGKADTVGQVDVDPTLEDSGSRPKPKPVTTSADSVAVDDDKPAEAPPKKSRSLKSKSSSPVRKDTEVSVDDPVEVMANKINHGLEDAVKTMGDLVLLTSKLREMPDDMRNAQAQTVQRLQSQLRDLINVGAQAKEQLFQFQVKETDA